MLALLDPIANSCQDTGEHETEVDGERLNVSTTLLNSSAASINTIFLGRHTEKREE
jgi:hypothetical protein